MNNEFILTAETVQTIFNYITKKGSVYDEIIDNIITPHFDKKNELISELAVSFLGKNKGKVNKSIKEGWFNYFFITAVKNQVHSSTSPFHKNCRKTINYSMNNDYSFDEIASFTSTDDNALEKQIKQEKYDIVEECLNEIKCTWFEREIFNLYYRKDYTHRQIEKEYNIDHVSSWSTIQKLNKRIQKQIKKKYIY